MINSLFQVQILSTLTVNQKRLKLDNALYATYNYDDAFRPTNIVNAADGSTITFGYDDADRLTSRVFPNGVTTTYDYDGMSRLKRLKDASTSATLFDRNYSYNNASQISQIADLNGIKIFGYDNVDRLTSVTDAVNGNESYSFDSVGNRNNSHINSTYSYQPFNRTTATASASMMYDPNGNSVQKSEGKEFWRYIWNHENRLTEASTRKQKVRYKYDALGRRVQRYLVGNKENTKLIHDGLDVLVDDNAGVLTKYLNGEGIDNKLRVQNGSAVSYFLADNLGSTNALTDSSGSITSQSSYDSFGNQTGNLATRYGFTGRERDDFSGLMYYRARFYDPKLGRFLSEDPIGFAGGSINLYAYVRNSPLARTDPLGLMDQPTYEHPNFNGQAPKIYCLTLGTFGLGGFFPDWMGYNSDSADAIWWNIFWERWNSLRHEEGPVIFAGYGGGPLSITDWSGYPDNKPPNGPFRILEGDEYDRARRAANGENRRLHRTDSRFDGKDAHERHPIKFGGDPTDPNNRVPMTREEHKNYNRFWYRMMRSIRK